MKVLLVEDDQLTVDSIRLCLSYYLPEVLVKNVFTKNDALESLRVEEFDVVLIDIEPPEIGGLEISKSLRLITNIPAFIISAGDDEETNALVNACGANGYITKPFHHNTIPDLLKPLHSTKCVATIKKGFVSRGSNSQII